MQEEDNKIDDFMEEEESDFRYSITSYGVDYTVDTIVNRLEKGTNLNDKKMAEFLRSFSSDWADYYESNVTDEMKSSLGSVYSLRNRIAHGGNESLSLLVLKKHYSNIEQLLDIVDKSISK